MPRCQKCNKKGSISLDCTYCECKFCPSCIQIEVHDCENKSACINKKHEQLTEKLKNEQIVDNKMRCPKLT